jgi:hypothetical protein
MNNDGLFNQFIQDNNKHNKGDIGIIKEHKRLFKVIKPFKPILPK